MNNSRISSGISQLSSLVRENQRFVLTTHLNPDADAIGSSCALALALRSLGKEAIVINANATPANLTFLSGSSEIELYNSGRHDEIIRTADVVVCLDLNVLKRIGDMQKVFEDRRRNVVMIDHHADPLMFTTLSLHDVEATSTAEIVYKFLAAEFRESVTHGVAQNLYAGIMADSGNFRFPRVTSETHRIVAALIDAGADPVSIYDSMYNSWSFSRTTLMGEALAGMKLFCEGQFCVMTITRDMLQRHACSEDSVEGAVQQTLSINGVRCGVLVSERETPGEVKISLRSKGSFYVNTIAGAFGGGGHVYAAGARASGTSVEAVVSQLVELVAASLVQLNQTKER